MQENKSGCFFLNTVYTVQSDELRLLSALWLSSIGLQNVGPQRWPSITAFGFTFRNSLHSENWQWRPGLRSGICIEGRCRKFGAERNRSSSEEPERLLSTMLRQYGRSVWTLRNSACCIISQKSHVDNPSYCTLCLKNAHLFHLTSFYKMVDRFLII